MLSYRFTVTTALRQLLKLRKSDQQQLTRTTYWNCCVVSVYDDVRYSCVKNVKLVRFGLRQSCNTYKKNTLFVVYEIFQIKHFKITNKFYIVNLVKTRYAQITVDHQLFDLKISPFITRDKNDGDFEWKKCYRLRFY